MMGNWGYGMGWFGGGLLMILVIAGLAALMVLLVRAADNGGARSRGASSQPDPKQPTAREILDARYARGELTQTEYEAMKRTLAG